MPRTFVCPAGTSAAKGVVSPEKLSEWVRAQPDEGTAARILFEQVAKWPPDGDNLKKLSAEVHSLTRMAVSGKDRVLLLASETIDGGTCCHAVRHYLEKYHPGIACEVQTVVGLQVSDADRFRSEGVVNFVRACLTAVEDFGRENVVLNLTSGYKALAPYLVLVGMLKRVRCQYLFEQSKDVLTLPPLPVAIDHGPFERYRELFADIERDTDISRERWEEEVKRNDREALESLVEVVGNRVTLSGVGLLLLDDYRKPATLVPFLSRRAWEECHGNLAQLATRNPYEYLGRMAAAWDFKSPDVHINNGNGTYWLKPGRTTDRYLVSVEGWKLLVWRAIREDQVGADYPAKVAVNPITDRTRHSPFSRMEFAD
ncbi:putative CRISPR-associated protein [Gemmata sp. JC673]|uniref:CRISPR-associated protein n=1 Tax=Gemmata algarum TaxID=2975278 RepID=A0ABU5F5X5_9BACT|nr:putative CRISPR-associated protein [Gemmata algarum]MDY3562986.1 putative CRISPR-associated protein [Gemmata algarum]